MTPPSNAFIFAPMFNQPPDGANPQGNDATGAFQPGAQLFANFCNGQQSGSANTLLFNNHASERGRFNEILHGLSISPSQLDTVAYFGHGTKDLLYSAMIGPGYLDEFVASLRGNCGPGATIILYACSCGAPGGIAEQLANKLSDLSVTVYAHARRAMRSAIRWCDGFPAVRGRLPRTTSGVGYRRSRIAATTFGSAFHS